ncbi:SMAD/FHA domain-containing protein [Neoconidiobolus thromboides FSU 785]|nr:SMAD/FHA domain-containing protein [Neoconidiobolus thromboides FSU 785]
MASLAGYSSTISAESTVNMDKLPHILYRENRTPNVRKIQLDTSFLVWGCLYTLCNSVDDMILSFPTKKVTFGRSGNNDYIFNDEMISGHHFKIAAFKNEHTKREGHNFSAFIRDQSSNGVLLNGKKLSKKGYQLLRENDVIQLQIKDNSRYSPHKSLWFIFKSRPVEDKSTIEVPEDL